MEWISNNKLEPFSNGFSRVHNLKYSLTNQRNQKKKKNKKKQKPTQAIRVQDTQTQINRESWVELGGVHHTQNTEKYLAPPSPYSST